MSQSETTTEINSEETDVQHEPIGTTTSTTPLAQAGRKRKVKDLESLMKKIKDVSETVNAPLQDENEFDIFGRSVAAQLKALPLRVALQTQQYVQNYITEARLNLLHSSPSASEVSPTHTPFYTPSRSSSSMMSYPSPQGNARVEDSWTASNSSAMQTPHYDYSIFTPVNPIHVV